MRKARKIATPREATVKLSPILGFNDLSNGSASAYRYADECVNFEIFDGRLVQGEGFTARGGVYSPPSTAAMKCYLYKRRTEKGADDRIMLYCADGKMYECPVGGGVFSAVKGLEFKAAPVAASYDYDGKDVIIFSKSGGGIVIYDGEGTVEVADAPEITSMTISRERLFVTTGGSDNALWFSDDFDPTNWNVSLTEAGFIDSDDFRGDMIKVVSFGEYLYVFKTYGITRISAYSDQSEFSTSDLFLCSGRIFGDSITVCGDVVLFAASDGLYRFDGVSAKKISDEFEKRIIFDYNIFKGQYYNGYAYLLTTVVSDQIASRQILKLNPRTLEASFINGSVFEDILLVDCEDKYTLFGVVYGTGVLCEISRDGTMIGAAMKSVWQNKESDFGIPSVKNLKQVAVYSDKTAQMIVFVDGKKRKFRLSGGSQPNVVATNLRGTKFKIRFESSEKGAAISFPTLKLEYYL